MIKLSFSPTTENWKNLVWTELHWVGALPLSRLQADGYLRLTSGCGSRRSSSCLPAAVLWFHYFNWSAPCGHPGSHGYLHTTRHIREREREWKEEVRRGGKEGSRKRKWDKRRWERGRERGDTCGESEVAVTACCRPCPCLCNCHYCPAMCSVLWHRNNWI